MFIKDWILIKIFFFNIEFKYLLMSFNLIKANTQIFSSHLSVFTCLLSQNEVKGKIPAYARIITRGYVTDIRADMSSFELFMVNNNYFFTDTAVVFYISYIIP